MIKELALIAGMAVGMASGDAQMKEDPLLGEWVRIATAAGTSSDAKCTFFADGTAAFQYRNASPELWRYSRRAATNWAAVQANSSICMPNPRETIVFERLMGAGRQMADPKLYLVPDHGVLFNTRPQAWCRPGDEERVRKLLGLD